MKKYTFSLILAFAVIFTCFCPIYASAYTLPAGTEVEAQSAILYNVETDTVVYEKDADKQMEPASTTKLMTALIVSEHVTNFDLPVTAYSTVESDFTGLGASVINIKAGEQISTRDLLYALLIPSACDAANVLAVHVSGSTEKFVELMNQKAAALGMTGTHYTNAHGLAQDGLYTTARDLVILGKEVLKNSMLAEICSKTYYEIPATNMSDVRKIFTTNYMMETTSPYYYKRVKGLKTGYTEKAGRCLVSYAEKDGAEYIGVVMGCKTKDENGNEHHYEFDDTDALLRWAFTDLSYACTVTKTTPVAEVNVKFAKSTDHVLALPKDDVYAMIPSGSKDSIIIEPHLDSTEIEAPVNQGQTLGYASILCAGEEIGRVDLVASEACDRSVWLSFLNALKAIFTSTIFKVLVIIVVLVIASLVAFSVYDTRRRRRLYNSKMRKR